MGRSDVARWVRGLGFAGALVACGGGGGGNDAGFTPSDSGGDAGGSTLPTLPAAVANGGAAAISCTSTEPAGGADVSMTMDLVAFGQGGDHAPNTQVCFCGTNVLSAEALAPTYGGGCGTCQSVMTDSSGMATVMGRASGWYAYRVFGHMGATPGTTFLDSIQINEPAPATTGGSVEGNAVTRLTANLISEAELVTRQAGTVTIAGRIFDCNDDNVSNAILRAFHADGTEILEGAEIAAPHFRYFDGSENPDASAMFTNTDGLYVVVNATPSVHAELIRVEAWAYTGSGSGTPTRYGCEAVQAFPDGVAIVNIGPERTDYPAGHPCN